MPGFHPHVTYTCEDGNQAYVKNPHVAYVKNHIRYVKSNIAILTYTSKIFRLRQIHNNTPSPVYSSPSRLANPNPNPTLTTLREAGNQT